MKVCATFDGSVPAFEDDHILAEETREDGLIYVQLTKVRRVDLRDPVPYISFQTGEIYTGFEGEVVDIEDPGR